MLKFEHLKCTHGHPFQISKYVTDLNHLAEGVLKLLPFKSLELDKYWRYFFHANELNACTCTCTCTFVLAGP